MHSILVTRPQPQGNELAERLRHEGFRVFVAPLVEYVPLHTEIPDLTTYQALAFTSAEGVRRFAVRSPLRDFPAFCVGEATAQVAEASGFPIVLSAEGDAIALAHSIKSEKEARGLKRVLHPCGEDTARDLQPLLSTFGVEVDRAVLYKARAIDTLPLDVRAALKTGEIDIVTLFSARTAAQLVKILQSAEYKNVSRRLELLCISRRVAAIVKDMRWKAVRVAQAPRLESVLEMIQSKRLDIDPATVLGWQKKDVPVTTDDAKKINAPEGRPSGSADRRKGDERRTQHTPPDAKGTIRTEGYTGPDRREGVDRRAYHDQRRRRVWQEKTKFLSRTVVSAGFLTGAVLYAVYVLLVPEIKAWDAHTQRVGEMEAKMAEMNRQMDALKKESEKPSPSLGSIINRKIEQAQSAVTNLGDTATAVASNVLSGKESVPVDRLLGLLSHVQTLKRTSAGKKALSVAMSRLKSAMGLAAGGNADSVNSAVKMARLQDPTLGALLGDIDDKHLGAAAMLLAVHVLRDNIDHQQPFADELALVEKFSGKDSVLLSALKKLAPYAAGGIAGKALLEEQFKGLAGDIVMAKLAGQDVSIKEKALQRLAKMIKVRKVDDIEGNSVDAKVARSEKLLQQGDVSRALQEMGTLEGAPAEAAAPWMEQAEGHVLAAQSSDVLSQTIMQVLSEASQSASSTTAGGGFSLDGVLGTLRANVGSVAGAVGAPDLPADDGGGASSVPYLSPSMQNNQQGPGGGLTPFKSR